MHTSVRIHNCIPHTQVLGPGTRIALWFQGCERKCPGCMSPETRPVDRGKLLDTEKLAMELCKISGVEGITISGGEPFLQADALYELLKYIKANSQLGIIIYTGYTMEALFGMNNEMVNEIITDLADLIIDGEYVEELNDGRSMIGSSNQRLFFISDRYKKDLYLYEEHKRKIESYITGNEVFTAGIPNRNVLNEWEKLSDNQ